MDVCLIARSPLLRSITVRRPRRAADSSGCRSARSDMSAFAGSQIIGDVVPPFFGVDLEMFCCPLVLGVDTPQNFGFHPERRFHILLVVDAFASRQAGRRPGKPLDPGASPRWGICPTGVAVQMQSSFSNSTKSVPAGGRQARSLSVAGCLFLDVYFWTFIARGSSSAGPGCHSSTEWVWLT